jgi:hypothetical protein
MLRVLFGAVASVALLFADMASADDTKSQADKSQANKSQANKSQTDKAHADKAHADKQGQQCCHATITKIAPQKDSITVKMTDKSGKEQEKTFQISKDVVCRDCAGKTCKIDDLQAGDDVVLTQKDGKLTEIKENDEAQITKVDPKAGTVTLKTKDENGKEVEKVFRLTEDAEYLDSSGHVARLDVFRSGDQVLVIEGEGQITGLKKSDKKSDESATARKPRTDDNKSTNK